MRSSRSSTGNTAVSRHCSFLIRQPRVQIWQLQRRCEGSALADAIARHRKVAALMSGAPGEGQSDNS